MGNNAGSAAGGGAIYGLGIFGHWPRWARDRPPFIRSG